MPEELNSSSPSSGGIFPDTVTQTLWTEVIRAKDPDATGYPEALEVLCRAYWRPVYLYIRGWGKSHEKSEDLTQEFFYQLIKGQWLKGVEGPERGRFRSFLRVVLKRFLADEHEKEHARKRPPEWGKIPIDAPGAEALVERARPGEASPEVMFDRHWALEVLERALATLGRNHRENGKGKLFEKLKHTISPGLDAVPYARLAEELEMSEGAVKVAVHRLRAGYRDCLRATLRETLLNPTDNDTDEELRYLVSLFSRP